MDGDRSVTECFDTLLELPGKGRVLDIPPVAVGYEKPEAMGIGAMLVR